MSLTGNLRPPVTSPSYTIQAVSYSAKVTVSELADPNIFELNEHVGAAVDLEGELAGSGAAMVFIFDFAHGDAVDD